MTDMELEERIRKAVEHAAPHDLDLILSFCGEQDPLKNTDAWTDAGDRSPFVAFRIILDVNPSIYLEVDREGTILRAEAPGEDARGLFEETDLTGNDLESAMDTIVTYLLREGYLSESQNSILISVEDVDASEREEVREKVSGIVEEAMEEHMGESEEGVDVLSQSLDIRDADLTELSMAYGISPGKADMIRKIVANSAGSGGALSFKDLAPLSVNELALLAQERGITDSTLMQVGHPSGRGYIGQHKALKAALEYAGVRSSRLKKAKVKLDAKKGRMIYKVKLKTKKDKHHSKKEKYKYYLDAHTGEMVRCKKDGKKKKEKGYVKMSKKKKYYSYYYYGANNGNPGDPGTAGTGSGMNAASAGGAMPAGGAAPAQQPMQIPEGAIGEQAAKAAALNHAGIPESNALYVYCNPQIGHGPDHYDVKFVVGGMKYKYAIGLYDGTVLGRAVKNKAAKGKYVYEGNYHEHYAPLGPGMGQPTAAAQAQQDAARAQQAAAQVPQDAAQAQQTAQAPQAAPLPTAVQMPTGDMISEQEAFSIALQHTGLASTDLIRWRVKLRTKHGSLLYRFKLKVPGFEHEVDVDAYSGNVTKYHKEFDQ